jgi:hypothetical protein
MKRIIVLFSLLLLTFAVESYKEFDFLTQSDYGKKIIKD